MLPNRVVILGASGFLACDLAEHLHKLAIQCLPVQAAKLDLREKASVAELEKIVRTDDALVFLSALTPDRGRDISTMMKNLAMGEHVCALLEKSPCAHVVYISSDAVYADGINPVSETSTCQSSSFYGLMHYTREQMLAQTLQKSKTPLFVLRPSLLFGAKDTHNAYGPNRFLRTAHKERRIALFGNGEEKRDHVYIKDLSKLIGLVLLHRSSGVLNGATGISTSFFDVASLIVQLMRVPVKIEQIPRQNSITHRHFDIAKTLKAFPGFSYTPLKEALTETYNEAMVKTEGAQ